MGWGVGGCDRSRSRETFQHIFFFFLKRAHFNRVLEEEDSLFAVSTPGGEELHHPHLAALQHQLVEVVVSELDHILLAAAAASAAALLLRGERALLSRPFLLPRIFSEARTCLL